MLGSCWIFLYNSLTLNWGKRCARGNVDGERACYHGSDHSLVTEFLRTFICHIAVVLHNKALKILNSYNPIRMTNSLWIVAVAHIKISLCFLKAEGSARSVLQGFNLQ